MAQVQDRPKYPSRCPRGRVRVGQTQIRGDFWPGVARPSGGLRRDEGAKLWRASLGIPGYGALVRFYSAISIRAAYFRIGVSH